MPIKAMRIAGTQLLAGAGASLFCGAAGAADGVDS